MIKITHLLLAISSIVIIETSVIAQVIDKDFKTSYSHFKIPDNIQPNDYMANTVIVKLKPQYRSISSANTIEDVLFKQLYTSIGGAGLVKKFPHSPPPASAVNRSGQQLMDLSLIYEFTYSASVSLEKVINKFAQLPLFQYAEPHYIPHLHYVPNDPLLSVQYAITNIQAENAWGINTTTARGDTNIVIGIVDTGTEPTHEDLKSQIKHNYADKIGGGDTDGDGYIDNFSGWDLGMNDNNPTWEGSAHGVHTSGIAAAAVNNAKGIAGVGFNCKFLPIKIADATGTLTKSYEGITYAADHGCSVISCSWGGTGWSQMGQDVVTYATINKNALVIASAGNDNKDLASYPAAYQYVISVANVRSDDRRSASSTWNYSVDLSAPGEAIRSTYSGNSYADLTGTSMSAPCVAGAAAIVHAFYPSYTALQIGERLKVTTDNNYSLMNPSFKDKLGTGRLNLYKALTMANTSPSVVTTQRNIIDGNDNTFVIGDTLQLRDNYTNYLAPTTNLIATLSTTSPYVTIVNGTATLGAVATLGTANNSSTPYKVKIASTAPLNQPIIFKITFSDAATSYTAVEYFTVVVNVDYINITINDVATTVNSRGRIGYNLDNQVGGLGFNYMNKGTIMYEGGLMIGVDSGRVSDAIRGFTTVPENEFQSLVNVRKIVPATVSDFDVDGTFNDNLAKIPIKIKVHQKTYAWASAGNRKFVIVQYVISNTGTSPLTNLYAGVFADWDIDATTFKEDRTGFDATNKMGYAYYTGANGTYGGVKLLTKSAPVLNYAMDNIAGGAGGIDPFTGGYNGFDKYSTLSSNRYNAGVAGTGNDILDVVSTGPYTIAAGDSIKVAFALIAGDNLPDIQISAVNAQIKYDGIVTTTSISQNTMLNNPDVMSVYPNPTNGESIININILETASVELKIFNLLGAEIKTIASEKMQAGTHRLSYDTSALSNGLYYYQLTVDNKKYIHKLMVSK